MAVIYNDCSASISACGKYRYLLRRDWGAFPGSPHVTFVMLNPSTADGSEDDPTIRKCVGFADRWGAQAIEVVNLFAWRATDPNSLTKLVRRPLQFVPDLVGFQHATEPSTFCYNDDIIMKSARAARQVIVAWGAHGASGIGARDGVVSGQLLSAEIPLMCLGTTKHGNAPRHPLMLGYSTPLVSYLPSYLTSYRPSRAV